MGKVKKAKKFSQKHLSHKIDQKKKEKQHAKIVGKHNPNKTKKQQQAGQPAKPSGPKFDVPKEEVELFDEHQEPGFAKYLSGSDDDNESDAAHDSDQSDYEAEEQAYLNEEPEPLESGPLTVKKLNKWEQELAKSPKPLRLIVRAAAAESASKITDSAVQDKLWVLLLKAVPAAAERFYSDSQSLVGNKMIFRELLRVYTQLLVESGSGDVQQLIGVIEASKRLIPQFAELDRDLKAFVKGLASMVCRSDHSDSTKIAAFDVLRGLQQSGEVAELAAKQCYGAMVKAAAHTNSYTIESLNLAKNLFATLFDRSTQFPQLYQLAFQQIRQLAVHLKTALDKTKNPDYDLKVIYTWQFVQSLDFWSRAVSLSQGLHSLIHPLVQVTLRVISLVPSPQFLPLRFYLVRSLVRLGRHTGVYIPLAPPLLEVVINSSLFSRKGKPSSLQQPDFDAILHVPQGYVGTVVYQNSVLEEFVDVFVEAMVLYTKSIAFPELVAPVLVSLRRFAKHQTSGNAKVSRSLRTLSDRLETNAEYISNQRADVTFGPRDKAAVENFLADVAWESTPLGKEAVARRKVREERQKLVAKTRQEDTTNQELDQFAGSSDEDGENAEDVNDALNELEREDEEEAEEELEDEEDEDEQEVEEDEGEFE